MFYARVVLLSYRYSYKEWTKNILFTFTYIASRVYNIENIICVSWHYKLKLTNHAN